MVTIAVLSCTLFRGSASGRRASRLGLIPLLAQSSPTFSNTQSDLRGFGGQCPDRVGLIVAESRGVEHPRSCEVLGECIERDASRQPWGASEHLDES
jgi:hypothetical protein